MKLTSTPASLPSSLATLPTSQMPKAPTAKATEPVANADPELNPDQLIRSGSQPVSDPLGQIRSLATTQIRQLEQALASTQSGHAVSRGFNQFVNAVNGQQSDAETAVKQALELYRHDLPAALDAVQALQTNPKASPDQTRLALARLQNCLEQADKLSSAADQALGRTRSSSKFWSSMTASLTSTLLVTGAAAVAAKGFGVPMNLTTASAGLLLGGATSLGTQALFDNQFNLKSEGLSTFLTGGLASAALVVTSRGGRHSLKNMVAMQATVGGVTAGATALAREAEGGFSAGWQKRAVMGTVTGASAGALTGVAGAKLSAVLPVVSNPLLQKGMQVGTGATLGSGGALASSMLSEAMTGFDAGWQQRMQQTVLGGAIAGGVLSLAPRIEAPAKAAVPPKTRALPEVPDTPADKTLAPPAEKPTLKPTEPSSGKVLTLADNERLLAFERKVMEHMMLYDKSFEAPPVLLGPDGKPIASPSLGYGSGMPAPVPPGMPGMPPGMPDMPDFPGMPSPILRSDGTPYNSSPGMGYGSAPPVLLKPDGTPVSGMPPQPVTIYLPDGSVHTSPGSMPDMPDMPPGYGGGYGSGTGYGSGYGGGYGTITPPPYPTPPGYPATPPQDLPDMPMPPPTAITPGMPVPGSPYPTAPYPGTAYPATPHPAVPYPDLPDGVPVSPAPPAPPTYPPGTILREDGTPYNLPSMPSYPGMPPGVGYGNGYGAPPLLLDADGMPINAPVSPKPILNEFGKPAMPSFKERFYKDVFQDDGLRDRDIQMFDEWTSTYSNNNNQAAMREAWVKLAQPGTKPATAMEQTIHDIYTTRDSRWTRLADKIGIPKPESFKAFRGTHSPRFVKAVVEAWRDNSSESMKVPVHELSSWSLSKDAAQGFAADPNHSVLFEADVPFDQVLADKFVDDGTFFSKFSAENEVIVALPEKNGLTTSKEKVVVTFQEHLFTYADREQLFAAWDYAQANPAPAQPPTVPGMPGQPPSTSPPGFVGTSKVPAPKLTVPKAPTLVANPKAK